MSRNLRQKNTPLPAQKMSGGGGKHIEESSDDDYGGVDQISDSDEDEPDVEVAEERAIIDSEEDDTQDTPRPYLDESAWDAFSFDDQQDILGQDIAFFEEHLAALAGVSAGDVFQTASEDEVELAGGLTTRRVRFNLSDTETGDEEDDGFFPDIFLPKDELDSSFRREIDQDDGDNGLLSDGSWEFQDADAAEVIEEGEEEDEDADTDSDSESESNSTGSSGYESG